MDKLQRLARFVETKMVRHVQKLQMGKNQGVFLIGN
jgi:hypothetical protein